MLSAHINYCRPSQSIMVKGQTLRSLWKIAKTLEMNPDIKGLSCIAWFLSAEAGMAFPHLAWMRSIYTDEGVYLVDIEAAPSDSGLLIGNEQRKKLYESGEFNPRRTLLIWPRDEMLNWAARHPELAGTDDDPIRPVRRRIFKSSASPRPVVSKRRYNSRFHVWNGQTLLDTNPKGYFALVLLMPALLAAIASALAFGWWAGLPAFILIFAAAWLVQYYCFQ
jgi:hypothetical protein